MKFWKAILSKLFEDTSTGGIKFSALDGLRGIAVLIVFLSHSSGFNQRIVPWLNFRSLGHLGVYLFFALSGFMLAYGLLGRGNVPVFRFYARRFLRIAPLYYLIVTLTFAVQVIFHREQFFWLQVDGGWWGYLRHLAFLQGDSVFWTIAVEFEFYFILPAIIWVLLRFRDASAWGFLVLAAAYGTWSVLIYLSKIPEDYALRVADVAHHTQYLDVFLCGVLGAYLARSDWWKSFSIRNQSTLGLMGMSVAAITALVSLVFIAKKFFVFEQVWPLLRNFSFLYGLAFTAIILCACHAEGILGKVLNNTFLRVVGITCFSWYLVHFIVINGVNAMFGFYWTAKLMGLDWTPVEPLRFALSFLITFVVAIALYLGVEKPFMTLSKSLLQRRSGAAPVVA